MASGKSYALDFPEPIEELEQYLVNIVNYRNVWEDIVENARGKHLVDACCGTGGMSISFIPHCRKVTGIDIDKEVLNIYEKTALNKKLELIQADLTKVPATTGDVIICNPPFGSVDKNVFVRIILSVNNSKSKMAYVLHPIQDEESVNKLMRFYGQVQKWEINVELGKTYKHHRKEKHTVKCLVSKYILMDKFDDESLDISPGMQLIIDEILRSQIKSKVNKAGIIRKIFLAPFVLELDAENTAVNIVFNSDEELRQEITLSTGSEYVRNGFSLNMMISDTSLISISYVASSFLGMKNWSKIIGVAPRSSLVTFASTAFEVGLILYSCEYLKEKEALEKLDYLVEEEGEKFSKLKFTKKIENIVRSKHKEELERLTKLNELPTRILDELEIIGISNYSGKFWESKIRELSQYLSLNESSNMDVNSFKTVVEKLEDLYRTSDDMKNYDKYQEKKKIISEFLGSLELSKAFHSSGLVVSVNSIGALFSLLIKKINSDNISESDRHVMMDLRDRLSELMTLDDRKSVSHLVHITVSKLEELKKYMLPLELEAYEELLLKYRQSATYEELWSGALRIKGLIYEVFFGKTYNLNFVPESLKNNLYKIIEIHFPNRVADFLRRCHNKPFIKDLVPDYYIAPETKINWRAERKRPRKTSEFLEGKDIEDSDYNESYMVEAAVEYKKKNFQGNSGNLKEISRKFLELGSDRISGSRKVGKSPEYDSTNKVNRLIVIEVGYQTASESKVESDVNKWKDAVEILRSIDIHLMVLCASDSSETVRNSTWLRDDLGKALSSTIPFIFGNLTPNMPTESVHKITGDISTAKLRSVLRSKKVRRSPITDDTVTLFFAQNMRLLTKRPTGRVLPDEIKAKMIKSLVSGSTMTTHASNEIIEMLKNQAENIIEFVGRSNLVIEVVTPSSYLKFIFGAFKEMFKYYSNSEDKNLIEKIRSIKTAYKSLCSSEANSVSKLEQALIVFLEAEYYSANQKFEKSRDWPHIQIQERDPELFMTPTKRIRLRRERELEEQFKKMEEEEKDGSKRLSKLQISRSEIVDMVYTDINKKKEVKQPVSNEVRELKMSQISGLISCLSKNTNCISNEIIDRRVERGPIDSLCFAVIPGRTGREKDARGRIHRLVELFGATTKGFFRDQKGLILAPHKDILFKAGVKSGMMQNKLLPKNTTKMCKFCYVVDSRSCDELVKTGFGTYIMTGTVLSARGIENNIGTIDELVNNRNKHEAMRIFAGIINKTMETVENYKTIVFFKKTLEEVNFILRKKNVLPEVVIDSLNELITLMHANILINKSIEVDELVMKLGSGAYIDGTDLMTSLNLLLKKSVYDDVLANYLEQRLLRSGKFEEGKDDRFGSLTSETVGECILLAEEMIGDDLIGNSPDYLPNFMVEEIEKVYEDKQLYKICFKHIKNLIFTMMQLKFFRTLFLYSKICMMYNNFVSEMTNAGIKIMKIQGTTLNLLCQVSKRKGTNCSCMILDKGFVCLYGPFFMNRTIATLGQSITSVLLLNILQTLQNTRNVDCFSEVDEGTIPLIVSEANRLLDFYKSNMKDIMTLNIVQLQQSAEAYRKERYTNAQGDSQLQGATVISSLIVNYSLFLLIPILLNKRRISKTLQMYRYPSVLSLSRYGFPEGVGSKMEMTFRSAEERLMYMFLISCSAINIKNSTNIKSKWLNNHTFNALEVSSLQLFPLSCETERQFTCDIYICHHYNKMMDDFSEGSISVANETFERVFEFERMLAELIDNYYTTDETSSEFQRIKQRMMMMLGIKNVSIKNLRSHEKYLMEEIKENSAPLLSDQIHQIDSASDISSNSDKSDATLSNIGSDFNEFDRITRHSSRSRSLASMDTMTADESPSSGSVHSVNIKYVKKTVRDCCEKMYKFTYGCPEVSQAAYEMARSRYPYTAQNAALKDKLNNSQISKISETTSIIKQPLYEFDLKGCIKILQEQTAIKLSKTMNKVTRDTVQSKYKQKSFIQEISKLILLSDEQIPEQAEKVRMLYKGIIKETRQNWRNVFSRNLSSVILTVNCSGLFTFFKTMWRDVKKYVKKNYSEEWEISKEVNKHLYKCLIEKIPSKRDKNGKIILDPRATILKENLDKAALEFLDKIMPETFSSVPEPELGMKQFAIDIYRLVEKFMEADILFTELRVLENKYSGASFPELNSKIISQENDILINHSDTLLRLCLIMITLQMFSAININTKDSDVMILKLSKSFLLGTETVMTYTKEEDRGKVQAIHDSVNQIYELSEKRRLFRKWIVEFSNCNNTNAVMLLINYLDLLISNIQRPFESKISRDDMGIRSYSDTVDLIKTYIAKSDKRESDFDFQLLVASCIKGGLLLVRKLLDRKEQGKVIPRAIRSKVIYEMIDLARNYETTNVQDMGFGFIADPANLMYAGIAPKAQIGAHRDLQVQERKSKVSVNVIESCSKSLLKHGDSGDALTNPSKKQEILQYAQTVFSKCSSIHGKEEGSSKIFSRCFAVNGDCTKWGPIHCTSYFALGICQLMKDHPDWVSAYKLMSLKATSRQLEIPAAVKHKITLAISEDSYFREKKYVGMSDQALGELYLEVAERKWASNPIILDLVRYYLSKGKGCVTSYNHMGQGIFHATSSLHGDVCYGMILPLVMRYIESRCPEWKCQAKRVSSSDDFIIIVEVSGTFDRAGFDRIERLYDGIMVDSLNYMSGLMRCCQMMMSEKTVVSDILSEFYSEFCFINRITPSATKYITNQVINNSVNSPLSLYQACHVECQQAFYNGVPMLTNIMLAILKQLTFVENSMDIYREHYKVLFRSVSTLGTLYLPQYSKLMASNAGIEDLLKLYESCKRMLGIIKVKRLSSPRKLRKSSFYLDENGDIKWIDKGTDKKEEDEEESDEDAHSGSSISGVMIRQQPGSESEIDRLELGDHDTESGGLGAADIMNLVMFKYYMGSTHDPSQEGFARIRFKDTETPLDDPFCIMVPESVRSEMKKLVENKVSLKPEIEDFEYSTSDSSSLSKALISKSMSTENYLVEMGRLMQSLNSKNIIWGLSGGGRELSIPFHRQMVRAYFFENRTPINIYNKWPDSRERSINENREVMNKAKYPRVRLSDFIKCVSELRVIFSDDIKESYDSEKSLFIEDIPVEIVYGRPRSDFVLMTDDDRVIQSSDHMSPHDHYKYYLVIYNSMMLPYCNLLSDLLDNLRTSSYSTIESHERSARKSTEVAKKVVMHQAIFSRTDVDRTFKNNVALVAAHLIDFAAVLDSRVAGASFEYLASDANLLENHFPGMFRRCISIAKSMSDPNKRISKIELKELTSKIVNECRLINGTKTSAIKAFCLINERSDQSSMSTKELIGLNTIEGCKFDCESDTVDKAYDQLLYILTGCISCINWIAKNENDKQELLMRFLRTDLSTLLDKSEGQKYCDYCQVLSGFRGRCNPGPISSIISSEAEKIGKQEKQSSLRNLAKLESEMQSLLTMQKSSTYRPYFVFNGDTTNGIFAFNSSEGEAVGMTLNSVIYITVNTNRAVEVAKILKSMEQELLSKFRVTLYQNSPIAVREQFFKLLNKEKPINPTNTLGILLSRSGDLKIKNLSEMSSSEKERARYIHYAKGRLTNRAEGVESKVHEIRLKWSDNWLKGEMVIKSDKITYSDDINALKSKLAKAFSRPMADKILEPIRNEEIVEEFFSIRLESTIPKESSAIIHFMVVHKKLLLTYGIEDIFIKPSELTGDSGIIEEDEAVKETKFKTVTDVDSLGDGLKTIKKLSERKTINEGVNKILRETVGMTGISSIILLLDFFRLSVDDLKFTGISASGIDLERGWSLTDTKRGISVSLLKVIDDFRSVSDGRLTASTAFLLTYCNWKDEYSKKYTDLMKFLNSDSFTKDRLYSCIYLLSICFVGSIFTQSGQRFMNSAILIRKISQTSPDINYTSAQGSKVLINWNEPDGVYFEVELREKMIPGKSIRDMAINYVKSRSDIREIQEAKILSNVFSIGRVDDQFYIKMSMKLIDACRYVDMFRVMRIAVGIILDVPNSDSINDKLMSIILKLSITEDYPLRLFGDFFQGCIERGEKIDKVEKDKPLDILTEEEVADIFDIARRPEAFDESELRLEGKDDEDLNFTIESGEFGYDSKVLE